LQVSWGIHMDHIGITFQIKIIKVIAYFQITVGILSKINIISNFIYNDGIK